MNLSSIVQQLQTEQQHQGPARLDTSSTGSPSSTSSSASNPSTSEATITADDFLQLLVSELQNQDPTADTDPNEYVNQLVDVNSLQQLISINQGVGALAPPSTAPGASSSSVVNALATDNPSSPATAPSAQAATARASYAALQAQAESTGHSSGGQSVTNDPLTPANASGVFDGFASTPMNSAIPGSWRPKTIAVP